MKILLTKIFLVPLLLITSFFGHQTAPASVPGEAPQIAGATNVAPINGVTYTLAGSGITSSATSITLSSFTIPQSGYKITDTDNIGTTFYITLEPGNRTRQEVVSCTTHTQNSNGSATLSGCTRGLSPLTPYSASSTLQFAHGGGTSVIFGDAAQLFAQYASKSNDETITGLYTFTQTPVGINPGGQPNSTESVLGVVELATQLESASSTATGSTGGGVVLQAKYATSSPGTGCGLCVPITRNDGKLSPSFIATTSADTYNFGGTTQFSASTTLNATTSIAASNVNSRALILNNVAYAFPPGRTTASSTVLSENGSGVLTWEPLIPPRYTAATTTGMSSTGGLTSFATSSLLTIPSGILTASSTVDIQTNFTCNVGSSQTCRFFIKDGTGANFTTFTISAATSDGVSCSVRTQIFSSGNSASSQITMSSGFCFDATTNANSSLIQTNSTSAINLSNQTTFNLVINGNSVTTLSVSGATIAVNP